MTPRPPLQAQLVQLHNCIVIVQSEVMSEDGCGGSDGCVWIRKVSSLSPSLHLTFCLLFTFCAHTHTLGPGQQLEEPSQQR